MSLKSLFRRSKKPKAASVTQPAPSNHSSTSGPSQAPDPGPILGSSLLETRSTAATSATSIVATLNENLTPHVSSSPPAEHSKKRKAALVNQPVPSYYPSTDGPSRAPSPGPISGSSLLETRSTPAAPAPCFVITTNQYLTSHVSSSPIPPPEGQLRVIGNPGGVPGLAPSFRFFESAQNFAINNCTIIAETKIFNSVGGAAIQLLESKMIRGAGHDSSARYPPPKCHPGTRKSLKKEIISWAVDPQRSWRMFYVLGPAGVGKSAVAQSVADEIDCLSASCFISRPNRRNDPDGVIPTLAHQLAVKHTAYKRIILEKLADDSTILEKTRRVQFKELLVDPFRIMMTQDVPAVRKPLLIIIDGLDECENEEAQCEFIELIGDHVRSFSEFPLLWLICSRPESHIKNALSHADPPVPCKRVEISVDDDEARQDVLLFLREEFRRIQSKHRDSLDYDWPPESELLKISTAASGLFAFASTAVRFVGDAKTGDPSTQLRICIKVLEGFHRPIAQNPYLTLDLLYRHILSSVPSATRSTTMRILGMSIFYPDDGFTQTVQALANFLCIEKAAFYHALKPLHSVLRIPSSSDALTKSIEYYHASFADFLKDPARSGEFHLDEAGVHYDVALTALRWHTNLGHKVHEDHIWVSPSENAQTCLKGVKSQSLEVLWIACPRVKGEKAVRVHQELQKFNFNVLGNDVPTEWQFVDFLKWLNQQEATFETQKLLSSQQTCKSCKVMNITRVDLPLTETPAGLFTEGKSDSKSHWKKPSDIFKRGRSRVMSLEESTKIHFDLGNGDKCRHIHIDQFMAKLWKETIPGTTSDSSDCEPPPRCHPGTRLGIIERCLHFIANRDGERKILLLVGAAGAGKSAIMRSVAESPELQVSYDASVFFPTNWPSDGHKAITTIAYQLATKCELYRKLIERKLTKNPSLFQLSMANQFNKLIVEPFIHSPLLKHGGRVLVIIDGLDECRRSQIDLLQLICDLCIKYPSLPLVWLITSRLEPPILFFFSRADIIPIYKREEISIDSDEARAGVERFLRHELTVIKEASGVSHSRWPEDRDIWKLANAAGGLFSYAKTVIRYIGDSRVGNPISQFQRIMHAIDGLPIADLLQEEEHPMALLDASYRRVLSKVPSRVMVDTRKFLLLLGSRDRDLAFRYSTGTEGNFVVLCNWLGMTVSKAYDALRSLHSVFYVPPRCKANENLPRAYHQSFIDYIHDPTRSGFSRDIQEEVRRLGAQCALRILEEAPDGIDLGDLDYKCLYGILARGPGTGDGISLTWLAEEENGLDDNKMKLRMYQLAIESVVTGIRLGDPNFKNELFVRLLITRFQAYDSNIPYHRLRDWVLDGSLRPAIMTRGLLKKMPLDVIAIPESDHFPDVKLQFHRPATIVTNLSDPWQYTCKHEWEGDWEKGNDENWMTVFDRRHCDVCFERLRRQVENLKMRSPGQTVWVLFTSTGSCCVELRFVDPEDGVSEWTYWFWCEIPLEERRKYGSPV